MFALLPGEYFPLWMQRMAVHQDYGWFAVLVLWSWALVVWWRHPDARSVWSWVPAAALASIAAAVVQFLIYDPTFDWFQDRLVPGTTNVYVPALISVELLGDFLIATIWATWAASWWWFGAERAGRKWGRWWGLPLAGLAAAMEFGSPEVGTWLLAAGVLAGAGWQHGGAGGSRRWLWLAASVPFLSTVGPIAYWDGGLQREAAATAVGLLAAVWSAGVGLAVLGILAKAALANRRNEDPSQSAREGRVFFVFAGVWLVLGLGYAQRVGADNRNELQQNRLRSVAAEAMVFDPRFLEPLVGEAWQWDFASTTAGRAEPLQWRAAVLGSATAQDLRRQLASIVEETPFLDRARILVLKDQWLIELASSELPPDVEEVMLVRRATAEDARRWAQPVPYIEHSAVPEMGAEYYCRAPLVAADGRMLGWLDYVRREFFQSLERKWRAGPLLVVALGLVAGALIVSQRRSLREREAAWRRAAAETESNRLKTAFLAKVSHELRTPLQSLLGFSELLARDATDETARRRFDRLQEHGQLLLRLVNDLLDLSAIEAGGLRLMPAPIELGRVVEQMVEGLQPRAAEKRLQLRCAVDPALADQWFNVDEMRLRQIVTNLVGNALKFTLEGAVAVELAWAERGEASRVRLTVSDTGPGVPPEQQATLFEAFSRLDEASTQEGSGLGLAIVAALAGVMQGEVAVESDGKAGAKFTVTLALAPVAPPAFRRGKISPPHASLKGRRIVVAEDNPLVRELFVSVLGDLGAVCVEATRGDEVLPVVLSEPCDAVVLDLALPGMDGIEVARRLRAPGVAPMPLRIVGVSAHAGPGDVQRALDAGMDEFLVKPVALTALASALVGDAERVNRPDMVARRIAIDHHLQQLFQADVAAQRAALVAALTEGDAVVIKRRAHYLANSASAVGDEALLTASRRLEHVASGAEAREVGPEVVAALDRWLEDGDQP